ALNAVLGLDPDAVLRTAAAAAALAVGHREDVASPRDGVGAGAHRVGARHRRVRRHRGHDRARAVPHRLGLAGVLLTDGGVAGELEGPVTRGLRTGVLVA